MFFFFATTIGPSSCIPRRQAPFYFLHPLRLRKRRCFGVLTPPLPIFSTSTSSVPVSLPPAPPSLVRASRPSKVRQRLRSWDEEATGGGTGQGASDSKGLGRFDMRKVGGVDPNTLERTVCRRLLLQCTGGSCSTGKRYARSRDSCI